MPGFFEDLLSGSGGGIVEQVVGGPFNIPGRVFSAGQSFLSGLSGEEEETGLPGVNVRRHPDNPGGTGFTEGSTIHLDSKAGPFRLAHEFGHAQDARAPFTNLLAGVPIKALEQLQGTQGVDTLVEKRGNINAKEALNNLGREDLADVIPDAELSEGQQFLNDILYPKGAPETGAKIDNFLRDLFQRDSRSQTSKPSAFTGIRG